MLEVIDSPLTHFAQEAERRRIARELHDGVVQSLTALVADLAYFRLHHAHTPQEQDATSQEVEAKLEVWQELAQDSLFSMRQALGGLRTHNARTFDLISSIHTLIDDMHEAGHTVIYEEDDWPTLLPFEYTSNLYYIIREVFTNIRKHAHASNVTLFLFNYEEHLHISIGDDGVGMYANRTNIAHEQNGYHQGLIGLYERTQLLKGHLSVESEPGKGTRVDIDIPLP